MPVPMPMIDGLGFLQVLKRKGLAVPVVITTENLLTPEWARDNGCAGFLRKPIETETLLREVSRCLRGH